MIINCGQCGQKNRVSAGRVDDAPVCGKCKTGLAVTGVPRDVTPDELKTLIKESARPIVVDFWAPWCQPCLMAAPELTRFAANEPDVLVVKLNTQTHPMAAVKYGVKGIPMYALFKDGSKQSTHAGVLMSHQIRSTLGL